MGGTTSFCLSILLALLIAQTVIVADDVVPNYPIPKACSEFECPSYEVINTTKDFEVRSYNSSVWISTEPFPGPTFSFAHRSGLVRLYNYVDGKNDYNKKIQDSTPSLTKVVPSKGWQFSLYTVSLYLPAENHADPPPAQGLTVDKWGSSTYVIVKQFDNIAWDYVVEQEAAALKRSLKGSDWEAIILSLDPSALNSYTVAQYSEPSYSGENLNEIWITLVVKDGGSAKTF